MMKQRNKAPMLARCIAFAAFFLLLAVIAAPKFINSMNHSSHLPESTVNLYS